VKDLQRSVNEISRVLAGAARFAQTSAVRELKAGHRNEGCAAITLWIRDRGRDCRKAGSNCQGQPIRRMQEDELCLVE
jgi:GH24 family phage-related lysozyme (muramidase)